MQRAEAAGRGGGTTCEGAGMGGRGKGGADARAALKRPKPGSAASLRPSLQAVFGRRFRPFSAAVSGRLTRPGPRHRLRAFGRRLQARKGRLPTPCVVSHDAKVLRLEVWDCDCGKAYM